MAETKRRSSRSLPLPTHTIPEDEFDEILIGEIIEDEPEVQEQAPREDHENVYLSDEGVYTQDSRKDKRAKKEQGKQERPIKTPKEPRVGFEERLGAQWDDRKAQQNAGSPVQPPKQKLAPMTHLQNEVNKAGKTYMENIRKSNILKAQMEPKEREQELTGMHRAYASMMVLSCLQPLSKGIDAKSVLSTVGMSASLWILSPNFRTQVGEFAGQMTDAIGDRIKGRKMREADKTIAKAADKRGVNGERPLSEKWQSRLDAAEQVKRGGRELYTAESAGMTEVALTENAYAAMREEGANVDEIRDRHSTMLRTLYEDASSDGIEPHEVGLAARFVVGKRLEEEPELASVFTELGHGQYTKSAPRDVRMAGSDVPVKVWTGEFESRLGQKVEHGSFGLRAPMSANEHQVMAADTMAADMISLSRQHGAAGLNMGITGYMAAFRLQGTEGFERIAETNSPMGQRLRAAGNMNRSMAADGMSPEEQRTIYSNAYVDAMEIVSAVNPEVEQQWVESFGPGWREGMRDFMNKAQSSPGEAGAPQDMGEHGAHGYEQSGDAAASGARPAGPAASDKDDPQSSASAKAARKYRNSRINQNYIETANSGFTGLGSDDSDYRDQDFEMGG